MGRSDEDKLKDELKKADKIPVKPALGKIKNRIASKSPKDKGGKAGDKKGRK